MTASFLRMLFVVSITIVFNGCRKCKNADVPLTEQVTHWQPYATGQRYVFLKENSISQTDTLRVDETADESIEEGDDKCPDRLAKRRATARFTNHPWRQLDVSIKQNLFSLSVGYGNVQFNVDNKTKTTGTAEMVYSGVDTLNNVAIADVIWLSELYSGIQELRYAKDHGLVQYTDSLGFVWNRQW